jgi:hypothetical protein
LSEISFEKKKIESLRIPADPNTKGFYEKMGSEFQRKFSSTTAHRITPLLLLKLGDREKAKMDRPNFEKI